MTTSSEDVLLQMGEVRFKKGDGTLYVMNERLAWMAENRDTVAVSHKFQDIKSKFFFKKIIFVGGPVPSIIILISLPHFDSNPNDYGVEIAS